MVQQLAMEDNPSCCWAGRMRLLTEKYSLPSLSTLLEAAPSKEELKKLVHSAVMQSWTTNLQEDAKSKTLLSLLGIERCCTNQRHPIWADIENPLISYPVTTCKTDGSSMCELCPLCQCEPESVMHFTLHCPRLAGIRANYLPKILKYSRALQLSVASPELLCYILNLNYPEVRDIPEFETLTQNFLFKLHNMRLRMLGGESTYRNLKD